MVLRTESTNSFSILTWIFAWNTSKVQSNSQKSVHSATTLSSNQTRLCSLWIVGDQSMQNWGWNYNFKNIFSLISNKIWLKPYEYFVEFGSTMEKEQLVLAIALAQISTTRGCLSSKLIQVDNFVEPYANTHSFSLAGLPTKSKPKYNKFWSVWSCSWLARVIPVCIS